MDPNAEEVLEVIVPTGTMTNKREVKRKGPLVQHGPPGRVDAKVPLTAKEREERRIRARSRCVCGSGKRLEDCCAPRLKKVRAQRRKAQRLARKRQR